MYFCYIDESGDSGTYLPDNPLKSGSKYFIMVGLITPTNNWRSSLDLLKSYRKRIAKQGLLNYDVEFHCSELINPHKVKEFTQIAVKDRWKLIEDFAETIGEFGAFSIIAVIIDKSKSTLQPDSYLTETLTKLYLAFDEFLKEKKDNGLLFFDRASEKQVSTHARKLMGTGSSGVTIPNTHIGWVIEDPIFRTSSDSIFIQAADVIAYCLKEKEFPQGAKNKFHGNKFFDKKLAKRTFKAKISDDDGIIRA